MAALHSSATAITDFVAIARSYAADIEVAGGRMLLSTDVTGICQRGGAIEVTAAESHHQVDRLVVCAGLQADRVSRLADGADGPRIVPFRGEYMLVERGEAQPGARDDLSRSRPALPVPRSAFHPPGLRRARGRPERSAGAGPGGISAGRVARATCAASPAGPGSGGWPKPTGGPACSEMRGSLSIRVYMRSASRYVPEIGPADVVRARFGLRAQAVDRDGWLVDDFRISQSGAITSVRNAPSPAATSSLAIARYVVDQMKLLR